MHTHSLAPFSRPGAADISSFQTLMTWRWRDTGTSVRSAWLSTQEKVLSQEKLWERGCGIGERRGGDSTVCPGPSCCVHTDTVSSCLGEGKQI